MSIYSAVPCAEEYNTAKEVWANGEWSASVTLRVDWALRHALIEDLLFTPRAWPKGPYLTPPGCISAEIIEEGKGATVGQCCTAEYALILAKYSFDAQELFTESLKPTIEFQKLDHKRFRWGAADGDPLLEGEAPGKQVERMELVRNWRRVPDPLPDIIYTAAGKTNDADYTSTILNRTFPAGTLLYVPPVTNRTIATDGSDGWDLTLTFKHKEEGWNKFWRSKTQDYEEIYLVDGSAPYENYPEEDLTDLLF